MSAGRLIIHRPDMAEPLARPAAARGAGDPALPEAGRWATGLLRRVHTYRRAGVLVGAREFLARRTACAGCELGRRLATHRGLYGCGGCTSCTGGPERMLMEGSTCQRGLWRRPGNPPAAPLQA